LAAIGAREPKGRSSGTFRDVVRIVAAQGGGWGVATQPATEG
jgi:hypothetical protein